MLNSDTLPALLCALIIYIPMVTVGIYSTKARIRYISFTNELRKNGRYGEWSRKNRIVLFSEKLSLYTFLITFFGFIITGTLRLEDIAKFLFICFVVFSLLGVISSAILFRKVPKE
jgi:hypothetical protein